MKDYFYERIAPLNEELADLLNEPVPYVRINRGGYESDKSLRCVHPDDEIHWIHDHIKAVDGKPLLVQSPFCNACNSYVGEL